MTSSQTSDSPRPGKLAVPYPVAHCANASCGRQLEGEDAYLYRDQESGKLVVFCDDCSRHVELNHPLRFLLVAL